VVEAARHPLEVGGHRLHQQQDGDEEQQGQQRTDGAGLADVLGQLLVGGEEHEVGHRTTTSLRTPAKRSSSGTGESTTDRASS
jgi:hypothetical protein